MKKTYRIDIYEEPLHSYEPQDTPPYTVLSAAWEVGQEVIPVERCDTMTGESYFTLYLHDGRGIPGNMNRNIRAYHGWRGTTNDRAVYAHGVHKIESVEKINGYTIKVKIGNDIHPDWD